MQFKDNEITLKQLCTID